MSKLISIIIPVYNERENIPLIFEELSGIFKNLHEYSHEIIFVNDGSNDGSDKIIKKISSHDSNVRYIEFSRNFGKEMATSAGLHYANGDAVIIIDADLQHPPKLIPEFIKKWQAGVDMVIGVRKKSNKQGLIKRFGSTFFYKTMNLIGEVEIVPRSTDYRLIDRKVVNAFNQFTERNRITRGLLDWLGFEKDYIYFKSQERKFGDAVYGFKKLVKLAMSSFFSYSFLPIKLAGYLGVLITLLAGALGSFIIVEHFVLGDPLSLEISGTAMLAVMILFLVGIILIAVGIMAFYVANIHDEVINRPVYVISKTNIKE